MTDDLVETMLGMHDHSPATRLVYAAIAADDDDAATRTDILEQTGFSKSTVIDATNALEAAGFITTHTVETATRGPNPTAYSVGYECDECGREFDTEHGLRSHVGHGHNINSYDLADLDAGDVGQDTSPPEPGGRGLQ